eukprot:scaffold66565_cov63-Phaeocystis_antarctica.AAC.1
MQLARACDGALFGNEAHVHPQRDGARLDARTLWPACARLGREASHHLQADKRVEMAQARPVAGCAGRGVKVPRRRGGACEVGRDRSAHSALASI